MTWKEAEAIRVEELKQYGKNRKERRANGYREKRKKFKLTK